MKEDMWQLHMYISSGHTMEASKHSLLYAASVEMTNLCNWDFGKDEPIPRRRLLTHPKTSFDFHAGVVQSGRPKVSKARGLGKSVEQTVRIGTVEGKSKDVLRLLLDTLPTGHRNAVFS